MSVRAPPHLTSTATNVRLGLYPILLNLERFARMNSYPPELLAQLAPVMFVAGLGPPQPLQPPTTPQSPAQKPQDPFAILAVRLKDALQAQRRVGVWQPDKSKTFQAVFVEPVRKPSWYEPDTVMRALRVG